MRSANGEPAASRGSPPADLSFVTRVFDAPLTELRQCVRELPQTRVHYRYGRLLIMLRRERWEFGKSRFCRGYSEEGLALRRKRPWRHVAAARREQRTPARNRDDVWSMDFVVDQLAHGRGFRDLTVVDVYARECLAIDMGKRLRAENLVVTLEQLQLEWPVGLFHMGAEGPGRIY